MKYRVAGLSDVGRCRPTNQDQFLVDSRLGVYAVADGMGGHAAGEVASEIAIQALAESMRGDDAKTRPRSVEDAASQLRIAINEGNRRILESVQSRAECRGMGTTLIALLLLQERAVIGHVGDSRAYLFRDGRLRLLTSDHSLVNEQVKQGRLTVEEAWRHPMRNIVTRVLGNQPEVEVDLVEEPVRDGDVFLLCSDGLNGMLSDGQIEQTLRERRQSPLELCRALVDLANSSGGEDNITAVVVTASAE
jgi:protein phosphatase